MASTSIIIDIKMVDNVTQPLNTAISAIGKFHAEALRMQGVLDKPISVMGIDGYIRNVKNTIEELDKAGNRSRELAKSKVSLATLEMQKIVSEHDRYADEEEWVNAYNQAKTKQEKLIAELGKYRMYPSFDLENVERQKEFNRLKYANDKEEIRQMTDPLKKGLAEAQRIYESEISKLSKKRELYVDKSYGYIPEVESKEFDRAFELALTKRDKTIESVIKKWIKNIPSDQNITDYIDGYFDNELDKLNGIELNFRDRQNGKITNDQQRYIEDYKEFISSCRQCAEMIKSAYEDGGHVELGLEEIGTYKQLEEELKWYKSCLHDAKVEERSVIQGRIDGLERLKRVWDSQLNQPNSIDKLETLRDCEKALSWYEVRMHDVSGAELTELAKQVEGLKRKRQELGRPMRLAAMDAELADLSMFTDQELKIRLEVLGLDAVHNKIKELNVLLADTTNPLGETERNEVLGLLGAWKSYEKQMERNNLTAGKAWGTVKGMGSSVKTMTGAIEGYGTAWDKVSGVIDGMLGLYDGFRGVVKLVDMLTHTSRLHMAAKIQEAAATGTATAATATDAATSATAAATEVAAAGAVTTAKLQEAAAKTMAAHAGIPWVGIAVAGGMVAAMTAMMLSLPKFADGGIAYGPTLGLFGEYAGASSNPEVVAPLSRLKELMGVPGCGGGQEGGVIARAEIEGRKLVLLLERELKLRDRS